ncbi:MAG: HD domain-containing protein [Planctomycetota bacterium]
MSTPLFPNQRTMVGDLSDGQSIEQVFRVADKQLRVNRQGGKYILAKLADRTGVIAAMMWNADEKVFESFERGGFALFSGRTQTHNGSLQIIATAVTAVEADSVDMNDFDAFDPDAAKGDLERVRILVDGLRDVHLRRLGQAFLNDREFTDAFKKSPAAVSHHHAFPGGLVKHTADMMEMAAWIASRYEPLNADLMVMGAFLHDLGKIEELSGDGDLTYTDRGQLVGHIVIGVQMLGERAAQIDPPMPEETIMLLEHLIVSHHGLLEYGSPKVPVTLEATALHHIDNLDAKLASYMTVIEADISGDTHWTNYTPSIGRKLWKKS